MRKRRRRTVSTRTRSLSLLVARHRTAAVGPAAERKPGPPPPPARPPALPLRVTVRFACVRGRSAHASFLRRLAVLHSSVLRPVGGAECTVCAAYVHGMLCGGPLAQSAHASPEKRSTWQSGRRVDDALTTSLSLLLQLEPSKPGLRQRAWSHQLRVVLKSNALLGRGLPAHLSRAGPAARPVVNAAAHARRAAEEAPHGGWPVHRPHGERAQEVLVEASDGRAFEVRAVDARDERPRQRVATNCGVPGGRAQRAKRRPARAGEEALAVVRRLWDKSRTCPGRVQDVSLRGSCSGFVPRQEAAGSPAVAGGTPMGRFRDGSETLGDGSETVQGRFGEGSRHPRGDRGHTTPS